MIKSLLKLGLLLVVGILFYNYFLGTPEEKASSKKVFTEIKEVGKSVGGLLKAEKEKFDSGKYDNALDKIGGMFDKLKSKVKDGSDQLKEIKELEEKKNKLKERLSEGGDKQGSALSEEEKESLKKELEELIKETEKLAGEIEE